MLVPISEAQSEIVTKEPLNFETINTNEYDMIEIFNKTVFEAKVKKNSDTALINTTEASDVSSLLPVYQ